MICPTAKVEYFSAKDWTEKQVICPSAIAPAVDALPGSLTGLSPAARACRSEDWTAD